MRSVKIMIVLPITAVVVGLTWFQDAYQFMFWSAFDPFSAIISNIRYGFFAQTHPFLVLVFGIGIVAYTCDLHRRESTARLEEVVYAKAWSNSVLVASRVLGVTVFASFSYLAVISLILIVALAARMFGVSGVEIPQISVIFKACVLQAPIYFLFMSALVASISYCSRSSVLSMVLGIGIIVGLDYVMDFMPAWMAASFVPESLHIPSDLDPASITSGLFKQIALIGLSIGLIILAGFFMQRNDNVSRNAQLGLCGSAFALSVALIGLQMMIAYQTVQQRNEWLTNHEEHFAKTNSAVYDIDKIVGRITVDPSQGIDASYEIHTSVGETTENSELVVVLNPGLNVSNLLLNGESTAFTFADGLLSVPIPASTTNSNVQVEFACRGELDMDFGYFYSNLGIFAENKTLGDLPTALGQKFSILNDNVVALMPTTAFYPLKVPEHLSAPSLNEPRDFFALDLTVDVPRGWHVAGASKLVSESDQDDWSFHVAPQGKIHQFALIVDEYHRVATQINGIEFELLLHPDHTKNLVLFGEIWPKIQEDIVDWLEDVHKSGLHYPHSSFSIAEVPASLRIYENDFEQTNLQTLPGLFLLNERGFPTATFERALSYREVDWEEDMILEHQSNLLRSFFVGDHFGGNVLRAYGQNLFTLRKSATGTTQVAINNITEKLALKTLGDAAGSYRPERVLGTQRIKLPISLGLYVSWIRYPYLPTMGQNTVHFDTHHFERYKIWDVAQKTALDEIHTLEDKQLAWKVVNLKSNYLADALFHKIDIEGVGEILGSLLNKYPHDTFTLEDFVDASRHAGHDIVQNLSEQLFASSLPGFQVSEPSILTLDQSDQQCSGYLINLHIHNGEPVTGQVSLDYSGIPAFLQDLLAGMIGEGGQGTLNIQFSAAITGSSLGTNLSGSATPNRIGPVVIPSNQSVEFRFVSANPITRLNIDPYLSLNRGKITVDVPDPIEGEFAPCETRLNFTPSNCLPEVDEYVLIDDLDEGFSVFQEEKNTSSLIRWLDPFHQEEERVMDQGLLLAGALPSESEWTRRASTFAFGRYRKTTTQLLPRPREDDPVLYASFGSDLPHMGTWEIEFHLPLQRKSANVQVQTRVQIVGVDLLGGTSPVNLSDQGTYHFQLISDGTTQPIEFDATSVSGGWNSLGEYDLPAAPVELRILSENTGSVVFADAVRFQPMH
ncbi:MAG: ABC transporter permease [Gammaproteobacteria bacterium]|nr:ABC transporter permease [Gammaproteobacteria bacterium]